MSANQRTSPLGGVSTSPFPKRQLFILALCRICEPIAFMSIFPYIYYMIDSFKIATDDRQIAMYAGMVTSAFAFAEFSTGVLWGRLSDRIGRKPVLLTGLAGTGLSMLIFGFAKSLPVALLARALGGLLNGNIGVLQTTVAELVTVKEHQPRAYTIMPFVWCLGSILGPSLGGALAQPVVNYPGLFKPGTIFEKFPFLLPNLICTVVVLCGLAIGILFLEETHEGKKQRRDPGLEAGKWILNRVRGCTTAKSSRIEKTSDLMEVQALIHSDEPLPGYRSTEGSPQLPSTPSPSPEEPLSLDLNRCESAFSSRSRPKPKPAVSKAFTRQVALNIVGYGILAYHTITFDQLFPVFLSTPEADHDLFRLPFLFTGGFNLPTSSIGLILSLQGLISMTCTILFFPPLTKYLSPLRLFRLLALSYPLLYLVTPYLALCPTWARMVGVYGILLWKCAFASFSYPANAILLANSAPSLQVLGTINGVAASTASGMRAVGPTVSGWLYSWGLEIGVGGLAWWCSALVAVVGGVVSLMMTDRCVRFGGEADEKAEVGEDEEACLGPVCQSPDHVALEPTFSDEV